MRSNCYLVVILVLFFSSSAETSAIAQEKNSTRKNRVRPSEIANKIGTAVQWEASYADALAKSIETGKPIFWYVPTLRGSFMDRKKEIDRYMLAGPFSWPDTIQAINDAFIPVRALPTSAEQKQFELVRYKFVEPGFLIINSDESVKTKIDHITTFSPQWFRKLLTENGANVPVPKKHDILLEGWANFRRGNYDFEIPKPTMGAAGSTEQLLLAGMFKFRQGKHEKAKELWLLASKSRPNSPLAWKAAAEAEGIGPFYRGFEIHRNVDVAALEAGTKSIGSAAPLGLYTEEQLIERSVQFLLGMQRQDGGWIDSDYDFGGSDSVGNVHVAVTSLCAMAMLTAKSRLPQHADAIDASIKSATAFVLNDANINRVDRDEILWAFAYRVRLLARLVKSGEDYSEQLGASVEDLQNVQSKRGHWYHEYNNSWVTATALSALHEAAASGAAVDIDIIERGCNALANDRFGNGSYDYYPRKMVGGAPAGGEEKIAASAGRMPTCDLGLWYWNKLENEELVTALQHGFEYHKNLAVAYKYDNHTSTYGYGGFFFWYDMRARSEAISQVADEETRNKFFQQQHELLMSLPEFDGCFVDSHELGRCYGTGMALLCFARDYENRIASQDGEEAE